MIVPNSLEAYMVLMLFEVLIDAGDNGGWGCRQSIVNNTFFYFTISSLI